jgi:S1-C subfamily serine protease
LSARRRYGTALTAAVLAVIIPAACAGGQNVSSAIPMIKLTKPVADFQDQLIRVVDAISPAVVQIQTADGLGSGVVYDGKGDIVTNAHVVGNFKTFKITLANGTYDGTLVGTFPADDLAVVHVKGATPHPATFADSSKLQVGEFALAIGNPLGLRSSVTEGIVSSLGRTVSEGNGAVISSAIQTSAAINPGNSGGALVDLHGQVIGIPTLAALDPQLGGAQAPGIGFAIPSNVARRIADQLIANGRVVRSGRAYLGVRVATIVGGGVLVSAIVARGPAAKAGIKQGDIILAIDGKPTPTADVLVSVLANLHPGQKVPVKLLRHGKKLTVTVTLGELTG